MSSEPSSDLDVCGYSDAKYLERRLGELCGRSVAALNLAGIGCMLSDQELILKRALDCGQRPSLVLSCFALRDFVDNQAGPPEKSQYRVFFRNHPNHALSLRDLHAQPDRLVEVFWRYFAVRRDYAWLLTTLTTNLLDRPSSLYAGLTNTHVYLTDVTFQRPSKIRTNLNGDHESEKQFELKLYRDKYNPPDFERFRAEFGALRRIIGMCQRAGISVVLVEMPITRRNEDLIPESMKRQYHTSLRTLSKDLRLSLIRPEGTFGEADFMSSVHMLGSGGKKFVDGIVPKLQPVLMHRSFTNLPEQASLSAASAR